MILLKYANINSDYYLPFLVIHLYSENDLNNFGIVVSSYVSSDKESDWSFWEILLMIILVLAVLIFLSWYCDGEKNSRCSYAFNAVRNE